MTSDSLNTYVFLDVYSHFSRGIAVAHAQSVDEAVQIVVDEFQKTHRQERFHDTLVVHTQPVLLSKNPQTVLEQINLILFGDCHSNQRYTVPYYRWSQLNLQDLVSAIHQIQSLHNQSLPLNCIQQVFDLLQLWSNLCQRRHIQLDADKTPYKCFSNLGQGSEVIDLATVLYSSEIIIVPACEKFALINGGCAS